MPATIPRHRLSQYRSTNDFQLISLASKLSEQYHCHVTDALQFYREQCPTYDMVPLARSRLSWRNASTASSQSKSLAGLNPACKCMLYYVPISISTIMQPVVRMWHVPCRGFVGVLVCLVSFHILSSVCILSVIRQRCQFWAFRPNLFLRSFLRPCSYFGRLLPGVSSATI